MEKALFFIFIASISGGLYICASRFMNNMYCWKKQSDDLSAKKILFKNWLSFFMLTILWLVIYALSIAFISRYIALAALALFFLIVDALALKSKSCDSKKDATYNKICLVINIVLALLLLIMYLIWVY